MASGYPDWTRAIRLLGVDADGNLITILTDSAGRLYSLIMGQDASEVLRTIRVDDDGQMIMVPRGESGYYMTVDSDGFLTTVLKGLLNGTLTTVAVDDQGYLAAYMLDDESQWGDTVKVGNAELAARLGSVLSWDWRGQVQVAHDFSKGLGNLYSLALGTGAAVEIDPTASISGGYSVKLTTGSDGDQNAGLRGRCGLYPNSVLGLSTGWLSDGSFEFMNLMLIVVSGGKRCSAYIRYAAGTEKLQYYDAAAAWQDIADLNILYGADIFHRMKLVVDIGEAMYVRALFDDVEYDLSAIPAREVTDTASEYVAYHIYLYGFVATNNTANIDMLTLTVKEPT